MRTFLYKILALSLLLFLAACDEDEKNLGAEFDSPDPTPITSVKEYFDEEEFSFQGYTELTDDLFISAKVIYFKVGATVKINQHRFRLQAQDIVFEQQTRVIGYEEREYALCGHEGKNSGSVELDAELIRGAPIIDLSGQNAGQVGLYAPSEELGPVNETHTLVHFDEKSWFRGCEPDLTGKRARDVPHLLKPKTGGRPGKLFVNSLSHKDFRPSMSERVSHGSYEAMVFGRKGRFSWWKNVPEGPLGQPGQICFPVENEFLCK